MRRSPCVRQNPAMKGRSLRRRSPCFTLHSHVTLIPESQAHMVSGTLQSIAHALTEYGMLGMLYTMPPALLLILGLKNKGHWAFLFTGAFMLSLACFVSGIALEGLETGSGFALSRSTLMVNEMESPTFFWISTVAFLLISLFIAIFGIVLMWRGLHPRAMQKA